MNKHPYSANPEFVARVKHNAVLEKIAEQERKEKRRMERKLTFSPGEQIWVGITLVFLCPMWVIALI